MNRIGSAPCRFGVGRARPALLGTSIEGPRNRCLGRARPGAPRTPAPNPGPARTRDSAHPVPFRSSNVGRPTVPNSVCAAGPSDARSATATRHEACPPRRMPPAGGKDLLVAEGSTARLAGARRWLRPGLLLLTIAGIGGCLAAWKAVSLRRENAAAASQPEPVE